MKIFVGGATKKKHTFSWGGHERLHSLIYYMYSKSSFREPTGNLPFTSLYIKILNLKQVQEFKSMLDKTFFASVDHKNILEKYCTCKNSTIDFIFQTLTIETAPRIISPSELQSCESGALHRFSDMDVNQMLTTLSIHSQRPFYLVNRKGQKQLFM